MYTDFFKQNGYMLWPESLTPALLNRFKDIADEIEKKALSAYHKQEQLHGACVIEDAVGPRLMRFDDLHFDYTDDLNQLIASPSLLKLMKEFCGPTAIPLQVDILYKHQHPHPVVRWHQGAPSDTDHHYLNIGVYLDDANLNDGCLRYVPGTQHELQDIDAVERTHGWNPPGVVQVPAKSGNIMVQEMMILHASEPKRSLGARRTIYIEVRPYEAVREDDKHDERWLELRRLWMGEILKWDVEGIFSEDEKHFFQGDDTTDLQSLMKEITEHRIAPIPAVYNRQPAEGPDYPVPADLM